MSTHMGKRRKRKCEEAGGSEIGIADEGGPLPQEVGQIALTSLACKWSRCGLLGGTGVERR
jgi:hypothetical protein